MGDRHKIRVLIAKPGLDGHDRGAKVVARALRDAGLEVIYGGLRQTPEMIVETALQEDVDVIGLSTLSGGHMEICTRILGLLRDVKRQKEILFIAGGIIPQDEAETLKKLGVAEIFREATRIDAIVKFIESNTRQKSLSS